MPRTRRILSPAPPHDRGTISLAAHAPFLISEWHPTKNGDLTPHDVSYGSARRVWWLGPCGHEWESQVRKRATDKNSGCPYCAGRKVLAGFNDLATTNPTLAKEWNLFKNNKLQPSQVTAGSRQKVWWLCLKCGHEWKASVCDRSRGAGCRKCFSRRLASLIEIAVLYYIKQQFPDAISGYRAPWLGSMQLDIFIPSLSTAVEYDGSYWHKGLEDLDHRKDQLCKDHDIRIIRIRSGCSFTPGNRNLIYAPDLSCSNFEKNLAQLEPTLSVLFDRLGLKFSPDVDTAKDLPCIRNLAEEVEYQNSLFVKYPEIAKQWHPYRNGLLHPNNFSYGSECKVWWRCELGHPYQAQIRKRVEGRGCPYCANRKVLPGFNDLATVLPRIARSWHPILNGDLFPEYVTRGSHKLVWWSCDACGHVYQRPVRKQVESGRCPHCKMDVGLADREESRAA